MSQRCPQDVIEIIVERINGMSEDLKKLRYSRPVVAHDSIKSSCQSYKARFECIQKEKESVYEH